MGLDSRGIVSVVELIVYIPAIITAFVLCSRHGFHRSSGWIYTLILCLVRIVGSICELVSINNPSTGLLQATLIIDSIGLSPLLFATLGLLSRLTDWINARSTPIFNVRHFRLVQVLITVGLILSIVGGTSSSGSDDGGSIQPSTISQVAIILYIVAVAACTGILLLSFPSLSAVPDEERALAAAVALALPFIMVRLAYSALAVFLHNSTFSIVDGNVVVWVCMAVLEEFVVVAIYLLLGFRLNRLDAQGEILGREWKGGRGGGRGRGNIPDIRGGGGYSLNQSAPAYGNDHNRGSVPAANYGVPAAGYAPVHQSGYPREEV
ncbi:hypothetical protein QBC46DRAFT_291396 [Diplogelasinospora grovesii]|uniref:DUF7702 domain-containing protein n=1 Tax=Diplogelasinospora grovesii TaxID=303347 RepID=A0AAN6N5U1_9PEZI|nr:hypothetical protein QBC46DRAFT_291396 [Diplogelasinospora grovesii]